MSNESSDDKPTGHSRTAITVQVTAETNAGGRRHMEDFLAVKLRPDERFKDIPYLREQAYFGVFDGHGGKEAARFARDRLWDVIQNNPKFQKPDARNICAGLKESFEEVHKQMEPLRVTWKTNKMGDLSTAGTTASVIIFRQNHLFVANVGDSTTILGEVNPKAGEPGQHAMIPRVLTKDHKPDDPVETRQVEKLGGKVMVSRKGVPRVVWERRREDPDGGDEKVDLIPFLSVSRALGDFWSFCPSSGNFVVSPTPDVHMHPINPIIMKFVVIASDGLWNVMSPKEVVEFIWDYEEARDEKLHQTRDVVKAIINEALNRWKKKQLVADNISVLIVFIVADDQKAWEGYSPTAPSCAGVVTPAISAALHAINDKSSATAASSVGESSATCSTASSATTTAGSPTPNSDSTGESSASTCTCTVSPASTSAPSSSGMCTCSTVSNNSRECSASTSTVSPPAATLASPTPNSGSIINGESGDEVRTNPTPPLTGSSAPLTTSPSSSSSSSPHSSSMSPSSSLNQSQEQQEQSPSTVSSMHATTSRGDSTCTSHYKETFSDGVIVEFHTKIKHRHRRKHKHRSSRSRLNGTHKDNDAISNCPGTSTCMSSSSFSLDPTGSLKRSPLKRGRTEGEVATASSEPLMKRSKLDLPDSGYDGSGDKMETEEDSSPPSDVAEADHMDHHDQTSSFEHSSGVETDDSQGRNKLAQNSKSTVIEDVSSPVLSPAVTVS